MEEVNELRLQLASIKTLSAIDHQGNTLNTNIEKSSSPKCCFLASWWYWISWLDNYQFFLERLWFCEDIHHLSILKLAIEKAIQNSTNANLSSKLFQDDSNYCTFDLNSLSGLWKSKILLRSHWDYWRGGQKNKKSHLWHGLMIGNCWDILGGRLLKSHSCVK